MIVMGIDPGAVSAAWGCIWPDWHGGVQADDIPVVDKMVNPAAFRALLRQINPTHFAIERVNAFPKQGVASSFRFGVGYGMILGVVASHGGVRHDVTPGLWKKHFRLDSDKEKARALAIKRFPGVDLHRKRDAGRAEALLLALWLVETAK